MAICHFHKIQWQAPYRSLYIRTVPEMDIEKGATPIIIMSHAMPHKTGGFWQSDIDLPGDGGRRHPRIAGRGWVWPATPSWRASFVATWRNQTRRWFNSQRASGWKTTRIDVVSTCSNPSSPGDTWLGQTAVRGQTDLLVKTNLHRRGRGEGIRAQELASVYNKATPVCYASLPATSSAASGLCCTIVNSPV